MQLPSPEYTRIKSSQCVRQIILSGKYRDPSSSIYEPRWYFKQPYKSSNTSKIVLAVDQIMMRNCLDNVSLYRTIRWTENGTALDIELPEGDYTILDFIDTANAMMIAESLANGETQTYSWSYSEITQLLKCTSDDAFTININTTDTMNAMLGFDEDQVADASFIITATNQYNFFGDTSVFIYTSIGDNTTYNTVDDKDCNLLTMLPVLGSAGELISTKASHSHWSTTLGLNQELGNICLQFKNSDGELLKNLTDDSYIISLLLTREMMKVA